MTLDKEGFTDDMAHMFVDEGAGEVEIGALMNFELTPTSDDSEVHVCGQRLPWAIFDGKEHIAFTAESVLVTKAEFWNRAFGATNPNSNGVRYKKRIDKIIGRVTSPYVGDVTPHEFEVIGKDCTFKNPTFSFAQGDGVLLQSVEGMCKDYEFIEQEPSDT